MRENSPRYNGFADPLGILGYLSLKFQKLEDHRGGAGTIEGTRNKRSCVSISLHWVRENYIHKGLKVLIQYGPPERLGLEQLCFHGRAIAS